MILQLLMTSLLITPGISGYNLSYKQNDAISTIDYNYEIDQEVYITDDDNLYISFTIRDDDTDEWFKVESERPLNDYMPWLDDDNIDRFPKELYSLPVAWFGVESGNFLYDYDLMIDLSPSENTLASVYVMPYDSGNFDLFIDYIYSFGISFDYITNYLFNYYANFLDNTEYIVYDPGVYINLFQGEYWNYSYSTDEIPNFGDLVIDLSVTYGHIQTLYDMKYGSNGLGSQINGLLNNFYNEGYEDGYNQGVNDGYNIRNDLYLPFKNAIIDGAFLDEEGYVSWVDTYDLDLVNGVYDFSSVVADIEDIANDDNYYNSSEDAYIDIVLESGVRFSDITFDIIGFEDMIIRYSDGTNKYYNDLFALNYTTIQEDINKFITSISLTFNLFDNLQDYKLGVQVRDSYTNGFDNGFSEGQQSVIRDPNNYGLYNENQYQENYQNGYSQGALNNSSIEERGFLLLFNSILNAPYNILNGILNFEIFGINLFDLVSFVLSLAIIGVVVAIIVGRRK